MRSGNFLFKFLPEIPGLIYGFYKLVRINSGFASHTRTQNVVHIIYICNKKNFKHTSKLLILFSHPETFNDKFNLENFNGKLKSSKS